jgi:hypothetical protein
MFFAFLYSVFVKQTQYSDVPITRGSLMVIIVFFYSPQPPHSLSNNQQQLVIVPLHSV